MTFGLLWLQLAGATAIIVVSATYLARSADVIAFKTGVGRTFAGVVLLATATSLPEVGTGVSAVALVGAPDLAAGDAFGSNLFNLLIIGLLDLFWRGRSILRSVTPASASIGALGIVVISLASMAVIVHDRSAVMAGWFVSPISVALLFVFMAAMYLVYRATRTMDQTIPDEDAQRYLTASLPRAAVTYFVAGATILGSAVWLAYTGDRIAVAMGWKASYVGTQFLALSTSLPELAASFAALRIGAPELAITNLLGSNLFNMGIVLFLDDLAYSSGALWSAVSGVHALSGFIAIAMTAVVILSVGGTLVERPHRFWTVESVLLIGMYVAASVTVFRLS